MERPEEALHFLLTPDLDTLYMDGCRITRRVVSGQAALIRPGAFRPFRYRENLFRAIRPISSRTSRHGSSLALVT